MRNLLIALVLGFTALTFYSALWFKSESIEDDITARVTDDLASSGAQNIDIGVDGRHVTLSGVVYDAATEDAYLETADNTYGALGPIDGLTVQADVGYINAIKTADGITLLGTVPNEELRAELVAQAQSATDGAVQDQMVTAGPEADWQGEAGFGVAQLAGLSSGKLAASAGAFSLSGNAADTAEGAAVAALDRDGWSTFISSPSEVRNLTAEVDRLTNGVNDRDTRIGALEGTVSDLRAGTEALTQERDTTRDELANLRASFADTENSLTDMRGQVDAATATIAAKEQTIADLSGQLVEGTAQIEALESELASRQAASGDSDEQLLALRGEVNAANGTIADLTSQVADRDGAIAGLTADIAERDASIETLNTQIAGFSATADQSVTELTQGLATRDQTIAELTGAVAERDATIEELNAKVSDLDGDVARSAAEIATLAAASQTTDGTVAALEGQVSALEGQVTDLTDTLAAREETIASLRNRPVQSGSSADQCAAQATRALEGSQINFETASARIASGSVELLERLTGIALACVGDSLSVEIGGHTDAQGEEADNQALSEARAQAVAAFMVERGVPETGLQAIGFGEGQPIADNETAEGRAQNRRISFEWQAR